MDWLHENMKGGMAATCKLSKESHELRPFFWRSFVQVAVCVDGCNYLIAYFLEGENASVLYKHDILNPASFTRHCYSPYSFRSGFYALCEWLKNEHECALLSKFYIAQNCKVYTANRTNHCLVCTHQMHVHSSLNKRTSAKSSLRSGFYALWMAKA